MLEGIWDGERQTRHNRKLIGLLLHGLPVRAGIQLIVIDHRKLSIQMRYKIINHNEQTELKMCVTD